MSLPPAPPSPHLAHVFEQSQQSAESGSPGKSHHPQEPTEASAGVWERMKCVGDPPCQRSLHAAAVWNGFMFVFGGYDGNARVNDLHCFNFATQQWSLAHSASTRPPSRDRHIAVVWDTGFYIWGGFDGLTRVNDMHRYDLLTKTWETIAPSGPLVPTPRHSHAAVVYGDSMFVFGGYDGSYRNDFYEFNFRTRVWSAVARNGGKIPKARYRGTCVVRDNELVLHGGHDGNKHLSDSHIFNFNTHTWTEVSTTATPQPRDSHVAVVHKNSMYILGGSTGQAMNDFHKLDLDTFIWSPVHSLQPESSDKSIGSAGVGNRFCHVGVMHAGSLFIFGGYDGSNRLNDFQKFQFYDEATEKSGSTLIADLKRFVNSELLSDITFIVEGRRVYAHKLLCLRCPYFYNMLTGEYMESRASELTIEDVRYEIFILFLEFLYSDAVEVTLDVAMELFQTADRFGVDRLKTICEMMMLSAISVESAAQILLAADLYNAELLRERCLRFILAHFDSVSLTPGFEEMSRANLDLNLEIIRRRFQRNL